ncbi:MAG: dihydroorotase [Bacteroidia bacterium]|nr:dihydroorotase [Bacteroidia bacterium]
MNYLIQHAEIIDPRSELNHQIGHLWIRDGVIIRIFQGADAKLPENEEISKLNAHGLKLSVGWFDMRASLRDPGLEHKETLATGAQAAVFGGFTELALLPNTQPTIQTKSEIAYIKNFPTNLPVSFHPIAAATVDTQGESLTEMLDLYAAGAVAFSDGEQSLWHSDIFIKALRYLKVVDGLLINRPEDPLLTQLGTMHEGFHSTRLGLRGIPRLAEEIMIQRDLELLRYTGGKLHFSLISSAKSVALIRQAKHEGLAVSCDIAAHQLAFDDSALDGFDTHYKVKPPFRTTEDQAALWEGLRDDTIDVLVSDHNPQDEESKNLEFDLAEFGIIGLETAFPIVHTLNAQGKYLSLGQLIEKISYRPREILGLTSPRIAEGEIANLTLFDTESKWTFEEDHIRSRSKNTPFLNYPMQGRAVAVFHKNQFYWHEKRSA